MDVIDAITTLMSTLTKIRNVVESTAYNKTLEDRLACAVEDAQDVILRELITQTTMISAARVLGGTVREESNWGVDKTNQ